MRILMLVQLPGARGPVPKHTAHLVAALRSVGCTVVTLPWGRRKEAEPLLWRIVRVLRDVRSVRRTLRAQTFDVAVVKTSHDWRTLLRDVAVVLAIRGRVHHVVVQFHGSQASRLVKRRGRPFKLGTRILLSLVDGIMVLSAEEQRQWQAFRARSPVFTVKNPYVRHASFEATERNSSARGHSALFVGRLIDEKGIFDLVEALPEVLDETPCQLHVVGEGRRERDVRARIQRLGLNDHVAMDGYLSEPELIQRYRQAALLVLPSWNEGFPTVLAEAMDAGLPIVTTRIRGAADHLVAGEHALFVEPRDVQGIASAMKTLLRDRDLRARMGAANRERVQIFDPQLVAAEYLQILRTIAGSR